MFNTSGDFDTNVTFSSFVSEVWEWLSSSTVQVTIMFLNQLIMKIKSKDIDFSTTSKCTDESLCKEIRCYTGSKV